MLSAKDVRFLSGQLNHDLREPINFITRKLELIEVTTTEGRAPTAAQQNFIKTIRDYCAGIIEKIRELRDDVVADRIADDVFLERLDPIVSDATKLNGYATRSASYWPDPNAEQEPYVGQIRSTAFRFLRMLRALLTVAKMNEPTFIRTNFRNQAVAASAYIVERFALEVGKDVAEHTFTWDDTRVSGIADQGMVLTIFQNIYENSIKYRSPDRALRVATTFKETSISVVRAEHEALSAFEYAGEALLQVSISDNGVGIPASGIRNIFDAYSQVSAHRRGRVLPGLQREQDEDKDVGIGLYTVRKMMAIHGGYVFATSDGKTGSEFHLLFPPEPGSL